MTTRVVTTPVVTTNGTPSQTLLMLRCMSGCISGMVLGAFVLWGILEVVNPAWLTLHGLRRAVDLTVVGCACVAGGWLAYRSRDACRRLSAFALAATPLVLLVVLVWAMMSAWVGPAMPGWVWGVPLLPLLSGVIGIRCSRRVPRRRLPSTTDNTLQADHSSLRD